MILIEILIGFALVVFCVGYAFLYEAGVILALQYGFLRNPTYDWCRGSVCCGNGCEIAPISSRVCGARVLAKGGFNRSQIQYIL